MRIHVSRSAQADISNSYSYYAEVNISLADRYMRSIDKAFQHILSYPDAYPMRYNAYRCFVMLDFPFVIIYKIDDDVVVVEAVFHTSRNPSKYP